MKGETNGYLRNWRKIFGKEYGHMSKWDRWWEVPLWQVPLEEGHLSTEEDSELLQQEQRVLEGEMRAFLEVLSELERRVIHLHLVEDKSFEEVDKMLGKKSKGGNSSKGIFHRALEKLRELLNPKVPK